MTPVGVVVTTRGRERVNNCFFLLQGFATWVSYLGADLVDSDNLVWARLLLEETFPVSNSSYLTCRPFENVHIYLNFILSIPSFDLGRSKCEI